MDTVNATLLKNRLGEVLARAALGPVAIERHGRIAAYLVPPTPPKGAKPRRVARPGGRWSRRDEERIVELCAGRDFRPSRWLRAGAPHMLAGVATMLASVNGFDRTRMLALAEHLYPGMSTPVEFQRWLAGSPVRAARLLPMIEVRMRAPKPRPTPTRLRP